MFGLYSQKKNQQIILEATAEIWNNKDHDKYKISILKSRNYMKQFYHSFISVFIILIVIPVCDNQTNY
jgi:hypothetical protein